MRVLIVDDSRAMRMIVRRSLRQAGFDGLEVEEAVNGKEALDRIRESAPDLVLCDWNMPVMSGPELLAALREQGVAVRFGFITSEGNEQMRAKAAEAGADFLIAKPFTVERMQSALAPVLG